MFHVCSVYINVFLINANSLCVSWSGFEFYTNEKFINLPKNSNKIIKIITKNEKDSRSHDHVVDYESLNIDEFYGFMTDFFHEGEHGELEF